MLANLRPLTAALTCIAPLALFALLACSDRGSNNRASGGRGGTSSTGESGAAAVSGTSLEPGGSAAQSVTTSGGASAASSGGTGGTAPTTDGGADTACVALDELCMDDHAGRGSATTRTCCEGSYCGPQICTNSVPSHCTSSCTCAQNGQSCREERSGRVTSEHACCDGFACTGCIDADAQSRLCVCRPR